MSELKPEVEAQIVAQKRRLRAYDEGVYELSDDEGFFCESCDWRGLTAPMSDYTPEEIVEEDAALCKCPACGSDAYTEDTSENYLKQFMPDSV